MSTLLIPGLSFKGNDLFSPSSTDEPSLNSAPKGDVLLITDHLSSPANFLLCRALVLSLKTKKATGGVIVDDPEITSSSSSATTDPSSKSKSTTTPPSSPPPRVILVSLSQDFAYWSAIAAKSNVNLKHQLKTGTLGYVDGLSGGNDDDEGTIENGYESHSYIRLTDPLDAASGAEEQEKTLKSLYNAIASLLRRRSSSDDASVCLSSPTSTQAVPTTTIIIDDLSLLTYLAYPTHLLTRFIRALRALCFSLPAAPTLLLIRIHGLGGSVSVSASSDSHSDMSSSQHPHPQHHPFDHALYPFLLSICSTHIEVRPLSSGKSGAISGEIAVHAGGEGALVVAASSSSAAAAEEAGQMEAMVVGQVQAQVPQGLGRKRALQYRLGDSGATFFQKGMSAGLL